jgi:5-(carboxyamino)imidazole ribonucleotide synthase
MILPDSTIGIFGSGQLGRMLAIEARQRGYRVATFSPGRDTPTGQVADREVSAAYTDLAAVADFAENVDVITYEFENVPSKTIEKAAEFTEVHPQGEILHITQNRAREKNFLKNNGFPVADFRHIKTVEDLYRAVEAIKPPGVLKTAGFGYDGKGQSKIETVGEIDAAFEKLGGNEAVLETYVDFTKEVSVVCARDRKGNFVHYGVIENEHERHILDVSFAPADVSEKIRTDAVEIARGIAEKFGYVGTLCVEFFVTGDEHLLVNEIAPRPHNSGHLTFDSSYLTSQFEQQLRAVCGLPLGSTDFVRPVAMANLLGDLWQEGEPGWDKIFGRKDVKLHLYGKRDARPGRKMGHLIAVGETVAEAKKAVREARQSLERS